MEIAGYRDIVEIGRGRASTVHRAVQDSTGRTVAIKVLSVSGVEERLRRRFEREMAATQRLAGHPNIAEVIDLGYTAVGHPFLTTAYYEHGSLDDHLQRSGPLPTADAVRIGARLADALDQVHRADILHRDIKPSNVLMAADGEPALTGFGISAIDPSAQAMTMAQSFAAMHTPPEVILGEPATAATDTYQLGSTLYTLLEGRAPFQAVPEDGIVALLGRIQSAEVPDLSRPDVPPGLADILRWAMAKDPAARPGAGDLADALASCGAHHRAPAPPVATAPAPPMDPYGSPATHCAPPPADPVSWVPAPESAPAPPAPPPVPVAAPVAPEHRPVPSQPEPTTYRPPPASPAYDQHTVRYPVNPTLVAPMPAPPDPPRPARRGCGGGLVVALVIVALIAATTVTVAMVLLHRWPGLS